MELESLVERFLEQESMHCMEGERGVKNLARLVNALGYSDFNKYGQMAGGACMGDIFAFLSDNSGAIEAILEWIKTRNSPEWEEALQQVVIEDTDEDTEWD
jgi:hypothetical protein